MKVEYFHEIPGVGYGNIIWTQDQRRFAARNGRYPKDHPVAPGALVFSGEKSQSGAVETMQKFRERGYWASCFPEGDGITMKVERGQKAEQVARDIEEVFGWEVVIRRGDPA